MSHLDFQSKMYSIDLIDSQKDKRSSLRSQCGKWDYWGNFENTVLYSVSLRQPLRHIGRQEIGTELLKLSNTIYLLKASLGENTMSSGIFPCHTKTIAAGKALCLSLLPKPWRLLLWKSQGNFRKQLDWQILFLLSSSLHKIKGKCDSIPFIKCCKFFRSKWVKVMSWGFLTSIVVPATIARCR